MACGGDDGPSRECETTADCETGELCLDNECVAEPDTGPVSDAGVDAPIADAEGCRVDDECGGGVCLDGACCDSASVCGTACCGAGQVCFANACVTPGDECRSERDCEDDEYCEPGLGEMTGDAGMPMDAGAMCLGEAPRPGRCVALPPRCDGDPMPGEVCIRDCEFRPEAGRLDAVIEWTWGADNVREVPTKIDVWSTPTVGRVTDTNCDGAVDELDPPNVIFVSGDSRGTCCSCGAGNETTCKTGVLRVLDGQTGDEVWSLVEPSPGSLGFSGVSTAIGDLDHDGDMEIVTITGEGRIAIVDHTGSIVAISTDVVDPGWSSNNVTGWGGGLTLGDMDKDGNVEIIYGRVVFTTDLSVPSISLVFRGTGDWGRTITSAISYLADIDDDSDLELLAGRTAYDPDGTIIWNRDDLPVGYSAIADFDGDSDPEVVHVATGRIYLLDAATGANEVNSAGASGGSPGNGGPPTVADFDGDGAREIGVAWREFYEVFRPNYEDGTLESLWATQNHDLSSSVTGSTVFDFEGDGAAEVVYNDECFVWVYDGRDGSVRFAGLTSSFTATEASLVADIDGDGSSEIVVGSNSASPVAWGCTNAPWTTPEMDAEGNIIRPGWVGSDGAQAPYRGITVYRDSANSWVGTRTLWNQHAYTVSNICGDNGACGAGASYGDIPADRANNWEVSFLNNFRQNIQGEGIFDAPDATVELQIQCLSDGFELIASVRNLGAALLPAGVEVGFFVVDGAGERELGRGTTTSAVFPGQVSQVTLTVTDGVTSDDTFFARILIDPDARTFNECLEDNNESERLTPMCLL